MNPSDAIIHGQRAARKVLRLVGDCPACRSVAKHADDTPPHGIERPVRHRHYFLNPATDLQVLVNVWPDGVIDAAFESAPGVFGPPQSVRRSESEVVTP